MDFKTLKTAITLALIVSAEATIAGTMGPVAENYDGFYLGADIGVSDLNVKEYAPSNSTNKFETHHLGSLGIVGGGLVGYDYSISDRFKLGLEAFMNANGLNTTADHNYNNSSYEAKSRYNVGARFLPGYEFSRGTVGHILLGYSNARYTLSDTGAYGLMNNRFNRGGFQSGIGMKTVIARNISLRIDGLYTTYGKKRSPGVGYNTVNGPAGVGTGVGASNGIPNPYRNSFSTLEGNVTILYKFNV